MKVELDSNGDLVIRIKVNDPPQRSASGKTLVVASSHGNKQTDVEVDGQSVYVGLNAYVYPKR